jgi:transmembrane 9 superfamily member 3
LFSFVRRALLFSTAIFLYAASSIINGYAGGSLYARMKGQLWIKQLLVGAFLVPAIICGVTFLVNFISIYYGSSRSIPFTVMVSDDEHLCSFILSRVSLLFVLVECHGYLSIHYSAVDCRRDRTRKKYKRRA